MPTDSARRLNINDKRVKLTNMSNPFELFDLPCRFDIDQSQLQKRYFAAAANNHPDRFSDPIEQADAAETTARITQAYRTLSDPELRAKWLLGQMVGSQPDHDSDALPPDMLMQMMEIREDMEQAIADNDQQKLAELRQWANDQQAVYLKRIGELFADDQISDGEKAQAIQLQLNALRYVRRMIEQMPDA